MRSLFPDGGGQASQPKLERSRFGLISSQVLLLPLILGSGLVLLLATVQVALVNTLALFLLVTLIGFWRCHRTAIRFADTNLRVLGTMWLIKVGLTLFLLYAGWMPQLNQASSESWGYDPQRFYKDAYDLIENGWNPVAASNYQGIIFYYGAFFYVFGHNPVVPALINAFVTLLGTLFLISVAYEFKVQRGPRDWTLAYLLLVPEILWYDVMTSRETLASVLVLVSTLSFGRYLFGHVKVSLLRTVLVSGLCMTALLSVRTTMAIPVVVSVAILGLFVQSKRRFSLIPKLMVITFAAGLLLLGPLVQQMVGGSDLDYLDTLQAVISFEKNVASHSHQEWSNNSIGLLLAPNNFLESILFLIPRMILYVVAPLPNIAVSITDLLAGSWYAWQHLLTFPTSLMMIGAMPFALAGFSLAMKERGATLVIPIIFFVTLMAVAGGNIIIHERYRLMMTPMLFASAWLGYAACTKQQIRLYAIPWYIFLASSAIFYMSYKLF